MRYSHYSENYVDLQLFRETKASATKLKEGLIEEKVHEEDSKARQFR